MTLNTGAPSRLTSAIADAICQRLRAGVDRKHAAESVDVARSTFNLWMQKGRQARSCDDAKCTEDHHGPANGDIRYSDFLDMVTRAEADAVVINVGHLQKAASKDPRWAAWWLERRHREDYGSVDRLELSNPDGSLAGAPPLVIVLQASDRPQSELDELGGMAAIPAKATAVPPDGQEADE